MLRRHFNCATIIVPILLLTLTVTARAEDTKVTYRVLGLCTPDCQNDLREAFKEMPDVQIDAVDYDNGECALHFDLAKFWPGSDPKKPPADENGFTLSPFCRQDLPKR